MTEDILNPSGSGLSEREILDRHIQSLGEADRACERLARNADSNYLSPRGKDYGDLKRALTLMEGTCRQMAHYRGDTRWLKLGVVYAKAMRGSQAKFVGQRWAWYGELRALFRLGHVRLAELAEQKTGRSGLILPKRTDWLIMPDHKVPQPNRGTMH